MFSDVEIETPPLADSRPDRTHQSVHPLRIRTPQSLDPLQQEREKGHFSFSGILRGSSNPFRAPIPIYDMTFPEPRTCNLHVHDLTGHFRASSPSSFPVFVRSGSRSSTGMIVRTGIPPSAPNPVPLLCVPLVSMESHGGIWFTALVPHESVLLCLSVEEHGFRGRSVIMPASLCQPIGSLLPNRFASPASNRPGTSESLQSPGVSPLWPNREIGYYHEAAARPDHPETCIGIMLQGLMPSDSPMLEGVGVVI